MLCPRQRLRSRVLYRAVGHYLCRRVLWIVLLAWRVPENRTPDHSPDSAVPRSVQLTNRVANAAPQFSAHGVADGHPNYPAHEQTFAVPNDG